MTVMPYFFSKVSIMASGAAEPPTNNRSSLEGFLPRASISFNMPSHTVGTPRVSVTPSASKRSHRLGPSSAAPGKTNFAPTMLAE
jgi:hypothetical protein